MTPIYVEQAIFSSSDRGSMKGYQLIAKSAGIDRETGKELCRWAPTRMIDETPELWTINAFPIGEDRYAISRTVVGGPEYSSRGASQIVTLILVFTSDQFSCYAHNPILVARTAIAVGALRLPMDAGQEKLDQVQLPGEPLYQAMDPMELRNSESAIFEEVNEVCGLLKAANRVAWIGHRDPLKTAGTLVTQLGSFERAKFSLTTGLAPAISRPFQLHFLRDADASMRHTLASQNIKIVEAA